MSKTKIALAAAAALGLSAVSAIAAPAELWQATGLAGPECALPDAAAGVIYVSNVNGDPMGKDAKGYLAKVSMLLDGKKVEKWVDGLKAPKGLAIAGGKLYTADPNELVEIDIASGKVLAGADCCREKRASERRRRDAAGNIYVSDTGAGWASAPIRRQDGEVARR